MSLVPAMPLPLVASAPTSSFGLSWGLPAAQQPRAFFRLGIILGHLGTSLEEVLLPAQDVVRMLDSKAHNVEFPGADVQSTAVLPWPLTDALGQAIGRVVHEAAANMVARCVPQLQTR